MNNSESHELGDKLGRLVAAERNARAAISQADRIIREQADLISRIEKLEAENVQLKKSVSDLRTQLIVSKGSIGATA